MGQYSTFLNEVSNLCHYYTTEKDRFVINHHNDLAGLGQEAVLFGIHFQITQEKMGHF